VKKDIRKRILHIRDNLSREERSEKGNTIMGRLLMLPEFEKSRVVFFYASFRSEVETIPSINSSLKQGKRVILPVVLKKEKRLALYDITALDELTPGYLGIPEPFHSEREETALKAIDLIIIPGAAYDRKGSRIGYGGGYYDRLLAQMERDIPIIAPAFKEQVVDEIPAEPHDKKVTMIITDEEVIHCKP
jgi:5-formyltetrahydrofolate cyclo-ligase